MGIPADPGQFRLAWQGRKGGEVSAPIAQAQKKTEDERRAFTARYIPEEVEKRAHWRAWEREARPKDRLRAMEGRIRLMNHRASHIRGGRTGTRGDNNFMCREDAIWYPANVYTWFLWLERVADIKKQVFPYRTGRFDEGWKSLLIEMDAGKTIAKLGDSLALVKAWEYGYKNYMKYMRGRVGRDLKAFLHRYQEGALVIFALLDCAGKGACRVRDRSNDISVSKFPGIQGQDPVEVWCLIERLRVLMSKALGTRCFSSLFSKYFERFYEYSDDELDKELDRAGFQTGVFRYQIYECIAYRKDVQALEALLTKRWDWSVRQHLASGELWKKLEAPVRYYLLCRAADRISFGESYASLPRAAASSYEDLVSALISLSRDTTARAEEAAEKEAAARERERIEKECAEKVREISYSPPATLEPRVLNAGERQAVRQTCINEIKNGPQVVSEVAATIDEFAKFCVLLAKPENHIKVRTAQYIERQVNARSEIDMVNEMARELVGLPNFIAYARVRQEMGGEQALLKAKIRSFQLPLVEVGAAQEAFARNRAVVEENTRQYLKPREQIRREIEKRQERWRGTHSDKQPVARGDEKSERWHVGAPPSGTEPDEPPPGTRYRSGR